MKRLILFLAVLAAVAGCTDKQPDFSATGAQVQIPRSEPTLTKGQLLDTLNANIVDVDDRLGDLEARPPAVTGKAWNSSVTYSIGDVVTDPTATPPQVYVSVANDNLNNAVADTNYWEPPPGGEAESAPASFFLITGEPKDNPALKTALDEKAAAASLGTASARPASDNLAVPDALPDTEAITAALANKQDTLAEMSESEIVTGTSTEKKVVSALTLNNAIKLVAPDQQAITAFIMEDGKLSLTVERGGTEMVDLSGLGGSAQIEERVVTYSNEACNPRSLYVNGDGAVVRCVTSGDLDYLDGSEWTKLPISSTTLTLDFVGANGTTDTMTVNSTQYTADATLPGMSGDVQIFVAAGTGREYSCSGTGITGSVSPFIADMSADRTLLCNYSDSTSDYTVPPGDAISISSLPYVINSPGKYKIDVDLVVDIGTGIQVNADDVDIYGQGHSITYGNTGAGEGIDVAVTSATSIRLYDIEFTQGTYSDTGDLAGLKSFGGGSGWLIKDCVFNVIARAADKDSFGVRLTNSGTNNEITGCTFNISGVNRFYGFRTSGPFRFHHNTVNVSNHTCPSVGEYPFVYYVNGNDQEIDNNTFNIMGSSERVNVILGLGSTQYGLKYRANIHHNTFNYASDHGRLVSADTGTRDWIVAYNTMNITSNVGSGDAVYAIRLRMESGGTDPSSGHAVHGNTITGNTDTDIHGVTIGDSGTEASATDIDVYNNWIQVAGNPLYIYSGACGDLDIYSNYLEATSNRYDRTAIVINGTPLDIMISNNRVSANQPDGDLLQVSSDLSADIVVCDSPGLVDAGNVRGGGAVTFQTNNCQDPWLGDPVQNL